MTIQFSGLSSGLDTASLISQLMQVEQQPITLLQTRISTVTKQQTQYTNISGKFSDLQSSIQRLTDAKLGNSFDLFASKSAVSSATSVSATATNTAALGTYSINVLDLATTTRAVSTAGVGVASSGTTAVNTISQGVVTGGNFTFYVNNQAQTVAVNKDTDTLQDVLDRVTTAISTATGGGATSNIDAEGKISLNYGAGTGISFGANGDTSNFASILKLTSGTANVGADTFTAGGGTSSINLAGTLIGNGARLQNNAIGAGNITIGGSQFAIDATTTLSGLLNKINTDSKAGVTALFNASTNKIGLISKTTGNQAITMDDGGTGTLAALGLVSGTDTLSSQSLGKNARFQINDGPILQSASNNVDGTVSGLTGVTLALTAKTPVDQTVVTISQNTDTLKTALTEFVTKFNAALAAIDTQTAKGATLQGESSLVGLRNRLRTMMSTSAPSALGQTKYKSLYQIGINTGSVNAGATGSATSKFALDETKFLAALAENPNEVKKLLIGEGATKGIANQLYDQVHGSLDPENGVFASRNTSANAQIKSLNDAIERKQVQLEAKQKQYQKQFQAMEDAISQLKSQSSSLASLSTIKYQ